MDSLLTSIAQMIRIGLTGKKMVLFICISLENISFPTCLSELHNCHLLTIAASCEAGAAVKCLKCNESFSVSIMLMFSCAFLKDKVAVAYS